MMEAMRQIEGSLPPRSRGSTCSARPLCRASAASPALAGIDPASSPATFPCGRFPRARGDRPGMEALDGVLPELPPRSRGSTLVARRVLHIAAASPALAGIDPLLRQCLDCSIRFPRARGDRPVSMLFLTVRGVLPPRSRGSTPAAVYASEPDAASPALAGIDPNPPITTTRLPCFPRARGDRPRSSIACRSRSALPPRSRGSTPTTSNYQTVLPASPALAGIDLDEDFPRPAPLRFPRARGDRPRRYRDRTRSVRLPPRSRGSTPAPSCRAPSARASPALAGIDPARRGYPGVASCFPRARGIDLTHLFGIMEQPPQSASRRGDHTPATIFFAVP